MTESNTTPPAPLAVEALPVVGYVTAHQLVGLWSFAVIVPAEVTNDEIALVRLSDAEAQLSTLRAEIYRLQYEQDVWGDELPKSQAREAVLRDQVARLERERDQWRDEYRFMQAQASQSAPTRPIRTHGALPPPGAQTTPLPPFGPHPATQMRGGAPLDVERVMKLADKVATSFHTFVKPGSAIEDGALWQAAREALRSALAGE